MMEEEFSIRMTDRVWKKVHLLMHKVKELNSNNEIGGWMTGEWNVIEGVPTLLIDDFTIPKQTVSGAEVEITDMADTLKNKGPEYCNRIRAHWHIHPFGTGDTTWSGTDEGKIADYMDPVKDRKIFVFLLSSYDMIKARVELRSKILIGTTELCIPYSIDNIPVSKESDIIIDDEIMSEIMQEIKNNVEQKQSPAWNTVGYSYGTDSIPYWMENGPYKKERQRITEPKGTYYTIRSKKKKVIVTFDNDFLEYLTIIYNTDQDILNPTHSSKNKEETIHVYEVREESVSAVVEAITASLEIAQESYEAEYTKKLSNW